jgi:PKD repeat protein
VAGGSSTLTWSSSGASSCSGSGGWSGAKATSGSQAVSPAATASYTLSCSGTGGSATQSATVTVSAAGQITPSLVPSRVSGVAPLYVFFDATASSAQSTTRPFHELEYRWDFGDAASGSWGSNADMPNLSRNADTGPVAAHVFQSPGTYTVNLTVLDGGGAATRSVQITVSDPDTVFAANTLCVGNSAPVAGSGGCPAGAAVLTSSDFDAAINGNIASRKRILFRRGDTFSSGSAATIALNGPGLIGAFGSGAAPRVDMTGNNRAIQLSSGSTPAIKDWRVMDLEINGNSGAATEGFHAEGGIDQVTLLRLNIHHVHFGVQLSPDVPDYYNSNGSPGHHLWDQFAVVDSTIRTLIGGQGGYGSFIGAQRFAYLGNVVSDSTNAEHILRMPYVNKAVVSHNDLSKPLPTKHVVKLHALLYGVSPSAYSEQVVLSDNKFTGGNGVDWPVAIGPQNAQLDERVRNVIVERNWFAPDPSQDVALILWAQEVTVRNNLFNLTGTAGQTGIVVERRGIEPAPANVHVYNNSFYCNSTGGFHPVEFNLGSGMVAKNNLGYAPLSSSPIMISGSATIANNTTNAGILASPGFLSPLPVVPADFDLAIASPLINAGTTVPVFSDALRRNRPLNGAYDLGAFERP